MSDESKCEVCENLAIQKCGGCHSVHYCSREHQIADWKNHKKMCKPFRVFEDEMLGRHLVATRDIKPGEIILREPPLIWGPSQVTVPVCLGCGNIINEKQFKPCTKCGWPVCSELCERSPSHIPDCQYTVSKGTKVSITTFGTIHPTYQCITVLRCLYQKQFLSDVWKKICRLQSHCEERKLTPKYEKDRVNIAQFILKFFRLKHVFTENDILKVCGILMVNGHEVPLTSPPHVALYEITSLFEHNCRANCNKTFTDKGHVLIKAGAYILKGEHLSICYTDPLWGTENRRNHLYESKFFWCSCARCLDPTEFGTNFSALRCQKSDCTGYLLPTALHVMPRNGKMADWNCTKCNLPTSPYHVHDLLERIGQDLHEIKKNDSRSAILFLKTYEKYLHNNHYYMTDVKLVLSQLIGHEDDGALPNISNEDLELKARLCQSVAKLSKALAPGETRIRGLLLFELHAAVAELGRRNADPHQLALILQEAKKILQESTDLLKNEPESMPEGKIYYQALKNLKEIEVVLMTIYKTIGDSPV